MLIVLYVPVVLGKVYDSKRSEKELTSLKISQLQHMYWVIAYKCIILRFWHHDDKEHHLKYFVYIY